MPAPPTRILSWQQMVLEVDPTYQRNSLQPWVFEFSNGRLFVDWLPVYNNEGIVDDVLMVQAGNPPVLLVGGGALETISQPT